MSLHDIIYKLLNRFHWRDSRQDRFIIIHNHLFKNAGTTVDWALKKNFQEKFVDHRDDASMKKGADYLGPYLESNNTVLAISSHHIKMPLPEIIGIQIMMLMFFRDPIERVLSVYNFEKKQLVESTPGAKYARTHNLHDYVLWRMGNNVPPTIRNFHTYKSLPITINWRTSIDSTQFELAKKAVSDIPLLGLVEYFDESMVLFEEELRPVYPDIDMSYQIQNKNQSSRMPVNERKELLRKEIGSSLYNMLLEKNAEDITLYRHSENLFHERISSIPGFQDKLYKFKQRCQNLV